MPERIKAPRRHASNALQRVSWTWSPLLHASPPFPCAAWALFNLWGIVMETTARASRFNLRHVQRPRPMSRLYGFERAEPISSVPASGLSIRVLKTAAERSAIAELRQYAPMDAERDLDAGAADLEELKDSLGVVVALYRDGEAIATIRAIPSGHGVTLAEKSWCDVTQQREGFGARSWEVGRLIVAPEHRSAELLRKCIVLALRELIRASDAEYLHASCSPLMARLYRRFGFSTKKIIQGEHGLQHALVHAHVSDLVRAFNLSPMKTEYATEDFEPCFRYEDGAQPELFLRAA